MPLGPRNVTDGYFFFIFPYQKIFKNSRENRGELLTTKQILQNRLLFKILINMVRSEYYAIHFTKKKKNIMLYNKI